MAYTVSPKEQSKMRAFGDTIRAWYMSPTGVPFHKDFRDYHKMVEFNDKARECGTRLTAFCGIGFNSEV